MGSQAQLGKNVKKARENTGLTQEQLAEKTGIHMSYVSRIERGLVNPSFDILENLAKVLKVKSSDLLPF